VDRIRPFTRTDEHDWTQRHVSHYVDSDLAARARRRLERHAAGCPECGRAVRAMKALVRLIARVEVPGETPTPDTLFSRVRAEAIDAPTRNRREQE
jgi:anti-sigma factor RsiW